MKKSIRLAFLGTVTVLGLSGFTSCDSDNEPASVNITELETGYKLTGTGGLGMDDAVIESIEFCYDSAMVILEDVAESDTFFITEDNESIGFYRYEDYLDTAAAGTAGRLVVGSTYTLEQDTLYSWTVTDIEQIECTTLPR